MTGVVTLIEDDHKELEAVFRKLESAEPDKIAELLQQVARLLIPHSKAEGQGHVSRHQAGCALRTVGRRRWLGRAPARRGDAEAAAGQRPESPGVDGLVAAMIGEVSHHVEEEEEELLPAFVEAPAANSSVTWDESSPRPRTVVPPN
jgi:hypothetical protein